MATTEMESALEKLEKLRRELATVEHSSNVADDDSLARSIQGFRLYEQGRYLEAREIFKALVVAEPRQAFHRAALGLVHLAMDQLTEAERELSRSIALSDREPSAFVNRGEIYLRAGRYADAARDFDRAAKLLPDGEDPLAKRARLLGTTAREMLAAMGKLPARRRPPQRKPKAKAKAKTKTKASAKPKARRKSKTPAKKTKPAARRTGRARRK